jgi:hypothetical protein
MSSEVGVGPVESGLGATVAAATTLGLLDPVVDAATIALLVSSARAVDQAEGDPGRLGYATAVFGKLLAQAGLDPGGLRKPRGLVDAAELHAAVAARLAALRP